eukprot:11180844-Lingulodinium_polyedra.AAC.1
MGEGGEITAPKLRRRPTMKVLRALDHALCLCAGRGLEGWCQEEGGIRLLPRPLQEAARQWVSNIPRGLAIVADQCGAGLAAATFLANHLGLSTILLMDPPHRFWNSEKLGLIQGDGWEV